jgi:hypothetical protein
MGEALFGLIMTLTFTLGADLVIQEEGREAARQMLIGILGCNLAWGIIDAAFYLIGVFAERGRAAHVVRQVKRAADPAAGCRIVAGTLPAVVADTLAPHELERVRAKIAGLPEPPPHVRLAKQDFVGAFGVFLLVFLSTLPVVVPFFFGGDVRTALRVSNAVAIVLLFGVSYGLARHAGLRPVRTGAAIVGIGIALVGIAIVLGG